MFTTANQWTLSSATYILCSHFLFLEPLKTSPNIHHSIISAKSILVIHKLAAASLLSSAFREHRKTLSVT